MMKSKSMLLETGAAFLLLSLVAACSGGTDNNSPVAAPRPKVVNTSPAPQATGVPVNAGISATFNHAMDPLTLTTTSFTVTFGGAATPVLGTVVYGNLTAVFWPSAHLADNTIYTATINRGAHDVAGAAMRQKYSWRFTTGTTVEPGRPVNLGTAANFAILAKAGISTVPLTSSILGDIGVSPVTSTSITGFPLTMDAGGTFATAPQVTGNVYASDYAPPTPANLTTAVLDMQTAFTDAAGRAPDVTELGAGGIPVPMTLVPGVYKWGTGLLITADVNLSGTATDVWIFQIAQDLLVSSGTTVGVTGGALTSNVFWQVTGLVDLDTTSSLDGVILTATAISVKTGAGVNGRLLAQTAVTLDDSTIVEPAP